MSHLLFLICLFATAFSDDLQCYNCDPSSSGDCSKPVETNVATVLCKDLDSSSKSIVHKQINDVDKLDIEPRNNFIEYECFSLYFKPDPTTKNAKAGVYRGCAERKVTSNSSCEYLKERLIDGNVTECVSCTENNCNVGPVNKASNPMISLGVFVINLICLKVFAF